MGDIPVEVIIAVIVFALIIIAGLVISHIMLLVKLSLGIKQNVNSQTMAVTTAGNSANINTNELPYELIAVITAAISAETGLPPDGFVVRSVRKVKPWNEASKREQQRRIY